MFSQKQIDELNAPLSSKHVKSRSQAGRSLSYIEGWHAISEANRIFGFGKWSRRTEELKQLGEPYKNEKGNWVVSYMARVRIDVVGDTSDDKWDGVTREGCGFGQGIDRDLGKAHESAIKEAETDAMKRALMTFGNPFGLALYDKEQNGVADEEDEVNELKVKFFKELTETIERAKDAVALGEWWKSAEQKKARSDFGMSQTEVDHYKKLLIDKIEKLKKEKDAA